MTDDNHRVRWQLDGFGRDDRLCMEVELSREQIAELRHLFDRGDDEWMEKGEYAVTPELWPTLRAVIGSIDLSPEVEYFIAASPASPATAAAPPTSAVPTSAWFKDPNRSGS